jgi:hypothetical protein
MTNHYHLVVETLDGNLARGMQQFNGLYSQYFNRRHDVVGHLFQGRYKAILVQRDRYMLELARYVVLNPIRAGLVAKPDEWRWSSYPYLIGTQAAPLWFDVNATLQTFSEDHALAVAAYTQFVMGGIGSPSPLLNTRHQLILGDDDFIGRLRHPIEATEHRAVAKQQRRALALSLEEYASRAACRDEAMAMAYHSNAYTMEQIGAHFNLSYKTVSRAVKKHRMR